MSEEELLDAMCQAYWKAGPGIRNSMRSILELLYANGYRRCAEGQGVTQWCDRAEKAEAEVERLRADAERYRWLRDYACHEWFDEDYPVQIVNQVLPVHPEKWREETDAAIDAARGES